MRAAELARPRFHRAAALSFVLLVPACALAAEGKAAGAPSEAIFVAQVVTLLLVGRLLGEVMLRLGQPAVVGQLIAGILLGPSAFGALLPHAQAFLFPPDHAQKAMLDGVAQLGVLLLLLLTGMETDVGLVRRVGRSAAAVSLTGIAVPFALGVTLGLLALPDSLVPSPERRLVTALFLGTALSISSIKIVAMVVDEMHFMRRNLGQVIVASAIIDDTIGWIIIAVTIGLAQPGGLSVGHLAVSVGGTLLFLALSWLAGRRLVAALMRFSNDHLRSELAVVTAILVVMGLMALASNAVGVHTVLGAFVAGVLVGQAPILTKKVEDTLRGPVLALFAPVFFCLAGLGADLTILADPRLLGLTVALIAVASLGKFGGAFLGAAIGGLTRKEALALALGMNARGSTEVIVATIGLAIGALDKTLFTMIVTMAVVTTTAMPPTLRWALARLPMQPDEAKRLEREAFETRGFVGRLERLLVARGTGSSGQLAARLSGLLGAGRDLPVTVMPMAGGLTEDTSVADVATAALRVHRRDGQDEIEEPDVTVRPPEGDPLEAVAAEGRKGYGLLVIGLDPTTRREGGLQPRVAGLLDGFEGVRLVVAARGIHKRQPADGPLRLLVPSTGTESGRRAAEVAFALAQTGQASVTALFVDAPPTGAGKRLAQRRPSGQRPQREVVLTEMAATASRFAVEIGTVARVATDTAAAILGQVRRADDTVVVLGVQPRPGEGVPFGSLAESLLEGADVSLILVVAPGPSSVVKGGPVKAASAPSRSAA